MRTYHKPIHALHLQELGVVALLQHLAFSKDIDNIRFLDRSEAMGNCNGCTAFRHTLKGGLNQLLAF